MSSTMEAIRGEASGCWRSQRHVDAAAPHGSLRENASCGIQRPSELHAGDVDKMLRQMCMAGRLIAVGNLKGGVGKTTLAISVACALAELGNAVVIDADAQASAAA